MYNISIYIQKVLTWKVAPEARLGADHPLCSGLTKDCNVAFRLLPQCCQPASEVTDFGFHVIVCQPFVLAQDQLERKTHLSLSICFYTVDTCCVQPIGLSHAEIHTHRRTVKRIPTFLKTLPEGCISFSSLRTSLIPRHGCGPKRSTA